jgi:hypothetical protein
MAEFNKSARRTRITIAKAAAAAALAGAAVAVAAPTALASGTSPTLNGCYSTWGSTGSSGHCVSVTQSGQYKNRGVCTFGNEDSIWKHFGYGQSDSKWGTVECTFDIEKSYIIYSS